MSSQRPKRKRILEPRTAHFLFIALGLITIALPLLIHTKSTLCNGFCFPMMHNEFYEPLTIFGTKGTNPYAELHYDRFEVWEFFSVIQAMLFSILLIWEPEAKYAERKYTFIYFVAFGVCLVALFMLGVTWLGKYRVAVLVILFLFSAGDFFMWRQTTKASPGAPSGNGSTADAAAMTDVPATTEAPAIPDAAGTTDAADTTDAPAMTYAPVTTDAPATTEAPVTTAAAATGFQTVNVYKMLVFYVDIPILISMSALTIYVIQKDWYHQDDWSKAEFSSFYSGGVAFQLLLANFLIFLIRGHDRLQNAEGFFASLWAVLKPPPKES